jgi:hypothetical protein
MRSQGLTVPALDPPLDLLQPAAPTIDEPVCRVLSGTFAWSVQGCLGAWVLGTLVYKRQTELPRRAWTIWAMDTSKQAFAMGLQHCVNLFLALFFSDGDTKAGECIWFLGNLAINIVCGLLILAVYVRLQRLLADRWGIAALRSGDYGNPPQVRRWLVQMILWGAVCCAEKLLTAAVVIVPLHEYIDAALTIVERPLLAFPKTELIIVMVLLPTAMNSFFAWRVDTMIRGPQFSDRRRLESEELEGICEYRER